MPTRSEQRRSTEQRKGPKAKSTKLRLARKSHDPKSKKVSERTNRKASWVLEDRSPKTGRASRKSTRAASNRAKPDTNFNLREQRAKGSPKARATRAIAKVTKARGRPVARPSTR